MFRYNQKKVNREVDELKKLLAITKGLKTPAKTISSSFLREDVNMPGSTAPPVDMATPGEMADTDAQSNIEKATNNTKITEMSDSVVKGEKYDSKLNFTYDIEKENPTVEIKELELDDDVIETLQKINAYFSEWKENTEKPSINPPNM
jgi:hypothetical protein